MPDKPENAEDRDMIAFGGENYGTKIPLTQADNAVTTSCDYPLAAGKLDCANVNISPMVINHLNKILRPIHQITHHRWLFDAHVALPGEVYFQIRNRDQFRGQLAVKC